MRTQNERGVPRNRLPVERFDGSEPDGPPGVGGLVPPCSPEYAADGLLVFRYAAAVTAASSGAMPHGS